MSSDNSFENAGYTYDSRGVRPTITIPKWYFNNTITFTIDDVSYFAKEGMTWGDWIESPYNTAGVYLEYICMNYQARTDNGCIYNLGRQFSQYPIESETYTIGNCGGTCSGGSN